MTDKKTVSVTCAVIRDNGRIFAAQRGYGAYKDYWEFPGGKIEPGETPEAALIREIKEELDTIIRVERYICTAEYDYPEFHLSMRCYFCSVCSGELMLKEHEACKWLAKHELETVDWLPADLVIIPELKRLL